MAMSLSPQRVPPALIARLKRFRVLKDEVLLLVLVY